MTRSLWCPWLLVGSVVLGGCCTVVTEGTGSPVFVSGLNEIRLVPAGPEQINNHPVSLTATEMGTLLHRVLYRERRHVFHRLVSGPALQHRVFRDDEVVLLAPPLARALAQSKPNELVFFHLSRPGAGSGERGTTPRPTGMPGVALGRLPGGGGEESTTGWIFVRGSHLYLLLREVQQVHALEPDINKYIREMPNIPGPALPFDLAFDPDQYRDEDRAHERCWSAGTRLEVLVIDFRDALAGVPPLQSVGRGHAGTSPARRRPLTMPRLLRESGHLCCMQSRPVSNRVDGPAREDRGSFHPACPARIQQRDPTRPEVHDV